MQWLLSGLLSGLTLVSIAFAQESTITEREYREPFVEFEPSPAHLLALSCTTRQQVEQFAEMLARKEHTAIQSRYAELERMTPPPCTMVYLFQIRFPKSVETLRYFPPVEVSDMQTVELLLVRVTSIRGKVRYLLLEHVTPISSSL